MGKEKKAVRLLVVDDHEIVRVGLRALLKAYAEIEVVGDAGTVEAAIKEMVRLQPDVALLDVRLPDGSGLSVCREIKLRNLPTRVIILTAFNDDDLLLEAISLGVNGYLIKGIGTDDLARAIQTVAEGKSILDPAVTRNVMNRIKSSSESPAKGELDRLSPQELRVLALVAQGRTNKEIGVALGLSDKTVKNYLGNVMEKLRVTRRSKAAAVFVQHSPK